jgi:glycogen debranching enzyme
VDGREPEAIGQATAGAGSITFVAVVRGLGDPIADPTVQLDRRRHVGPGALIEEIEIVSGADRPVSATVTLDLAVDLAAMETVRSGGSGEALPAERSGDRLIFRRGPVSVTVTASDGGLERGSGTRLRWDITLAPRGRVFFHWELTVTDAGGVVHPPARREPEWSRLRVHSADHRLTRLVDRSLDDLAALRLTDGADTFLGAGVPWFLTLFGRDSLWAARMLLPLGTDLAAGTLRVLARRQGTRVDDSTGEAPGKIMHELRRDEHVLTEANLRLPAVYYGTIDATPLWISLLHDAWRWGHPAAEIEALLPNLDAALGWLADHADPDGDGFLEYVRRGARAADRRAPCGRRRRRLGHRPARRPAGPAPGTATRRPAGRGPGRRTTARRPTARG